jgi:hypothetical protein
MKDFKFFKLTARHKWMFIVSKVTIFILIIVMAVLALNMARISLPTIDEQVTFGIGFMSIMFIFALAMFNRISVLFKIKSIGFVLAFILLLLIKASIEAMTWAVGLMAIPLIIDDAILGPIWLNIWYKHYDQ